MRLRIFSIVGEALNFGGRRMGTIASIALLPVGLLFIVNMVTVFAYLTVIAGRVITFSDAGTFANAVAVLNQYLQQAWQVKPVEMLAITGVSVFLQALLMASFMAPLIRYSGLGEKPSPGFIRLPFGADQIRYVLSGFVSNIFAAVVVMIPMTSASYFILKYLFDAMSKTLASFPDPNSLHTIEFVTVGQQLAASGTSWHFNLGLPLLVAAPFALMVWGVNFFHFHPRNRVKAPEGGNAFLRLLVTLLTSIGAIAFVYWLMSEFLSTLLTSVASANQELSQVVSTTPVNAYLLIGAILVLLVTYLNLRLSSYQGIAVCRKSMGPGNLLRVTRGWNLVRLPIVWALVLGLLYAVQYFVNVIIFTSFDATVETLFAALGSTTRLVNSGVTAEWVGPLKIWVSNLSKIAFNFVWAFFSYGVLAGLYGRLYRESEREEEIDAGASGKKAIWRK